VWLFVIARWLVVGKAEQPACLLEKRKTLFIGNSGTTSPKEAKSVCTTTREAA
jgi:hypothetical protein